jgi:hypothetical protein
MVVRWYSCQCGIPGGYLCKMVIDVHTKGSLGGHALCDGPREGPCKITE